MTAAAPFDGDEAVMDIVFTSGGLFDITSDIQRTGLAGSDGILILRFDNCSAGTVEYDITSIDAQGVVPIARVANDNVSLCNDLLEASQ